MLACFGLGNTVERLADLGLSRLATGHVRTVGALSGEDAWEVVAGTLDVVFAQHSFADGPLGKQAREQWIGAAADAIVDEKRGLSAPPHERVQGARASRVAGRRRRQSAGCHDARKGARLQAGILWCAAASMGPGMRPLWLAPSRKPATDVCR